MTVYTSPVVEKPMETTDYPLSTGEIKAVMAIAELAKQGEVLEGLMMSPLWDLKKTCEKALQSQKPKKVKSSG